MAHKVISACKGPFLISHRFSSLLGMKLSISYIVSYHFQELDKETLILFCRIS